MKEGGNKLGCLPKEKFDGDFFKSWTGIVNEKDFEKVFFKLKL